MSELVPEVAVPVMTLVAEVIEPGAAPEGDAARVQVSWFAVPGFCTAALKD